MHRAASRLNALPHGQHLGKVTPIKRYQRLALALLGRLRHLRGLGRGHARRFLHRGMQPALQAIEHNGQQVAGHGNHVHHIRLANIEHLPIVGKGAFRPPFGLIFAQPLFVQLGNAHQAQAWLFGNHAEVRLGVAAAANDRYFQICHGISFPKRLSPKPKIIVNIQCCVLLCSLFVDKFDRGL